MCFSAIETAAAAVVLPSVHFYSSSNILPKSMRLFITPSEDSEAETVSKSVSLREFFFFSLIINGIKKIYEGNDFFFFDMRSFWERIGSYIWYVIEEYLIWITRCGFLLFVISMELSRKDRETFFQGATVYFNDIF